MCVRPSDSYSGVNRAECTPAVCASVACQIRAGLMRDWPVTISGVSYNINRFILNSAFHYKKILKYAVNTNKTNVEIWQVLVLVFHRFR